MMKHKCILQSLRGLLFVLTLFGLAGCSSLEQLIKVPTRDKSATVESYNTKLHQQSIHIFDPVPLEQSITELRLEPRVDHLFFLIDQSPALSDEYRGIDARLYAREMVRRFVRTMPDQLYSGALLIIDQHPEAPDSPELRIRNYTGNDIEQALDTSGATYRVDAFSLTAALDQLTKLIRSTHGRSAVILVSSWSQINLQVEEAVMRMRQSIREAQGPGQSGVCFYTLGVGNRLSRSRLETVDSCGHSMAADKVAQPRDMAHFVKRVLYKGPADSDGDGIYDYRDRCPKTPANRIVDYSGCPRFSASKGRL